ncbi:MAG: hypothetical protein QM537_09950 [Candidatus Symbiobacter sp.]|nr:hypothetical protein [Candidatus Symbiobacter sp.]
MTGNQKPPLHHDPQKSETLRRAERAQAILDDPMVQAAFRALERDCLDRWRHSPAHDREGRERLYQLLGLIDQLRQDFTSLVLSGRMSQVQNNPMPEA